MTTKGSPHKFGTIPPGDPSKVRGSDGWTDISTFPGYSGHFMVRRVASDGRRYLSGAGYSFPGVWEDDDIDGEIVQWKPWPERAWLPKPLRVPSEAEIQAWNRPPPAQPDVAPEGADLAPPDDWRDIDTAPTDETPVLVWHKANDIDLEHYTVEKVRSAAHRFSLRTVWDATHWHPLPEPPKGHEP